MCEVSVTRLAVFSVFLLLRCGTLSAKAEECNLNGVNEDDLIEPVPKVECAQGRINEYSGSCVCDDGWSGPACEICTRKPCLPQARISAIRPRSGPIQSIPTVQFVGVGFPRNHNKAYECIFNTTKAPGHWLNSTVVECIRPNLTSRSPYELILIPSGLQMVIKSAALQLMHFYESCNPSLCKGTCFEELCVCPPGLVGENCAETVVESRHSCNTTSNLTTELTAEELEPVSYLVTPNTTEKLEQVHSSIAELHVNQITRRIEWTSPIAAGHDQTIQVLLKGSYCADELNFTVSVRESYKPMLASVTRHKDSNMHRLTGFIKYNGTTKLQQKNVPVVIKVVERDVLVEKLEVWSEQRFFAHDLYPYTGDHRDYHIFSEHPMTTSQNAPGLPMQQCTVDAVYDQNVVLGDMPFTLKYDLRSQSCACGEWTAEIISPRQLVHVRSQRITSDQRNPTIQLVASIDHTEDDQLENMYVAISCDYLVTYTARHHLIRKMESRARVEPDSLDLVVDERGPPTFVDIRVHMPYRPTTASMLTDDLSPFFLVSAPNSRMKNNKTVVVDYVFGVQNPLKEQILEGVLKYPSEKNALFQVPYRVTKTRSVDYKIRISARCLTYFQNKFAEVVLKSGQDGQVISKSIKVNSAVELGPMSAGVYELQVLAEDFHPFYSLVRVSTENTTVDVVLEQRETTKLAFEGNDLMFVRTEKTSLRPELQMDPAVIKTLDEDIWVSFVYRNGPQNSMAMLTQDAFDQHYKIENLPLHMAICVGCGYRHRIKLSAVSDSTTTPNQINVIRIPYVYTIPGVMRDFNDEITVLVDIRSSKDMAPAVYPPGLPLARFSALSANCQTDLLLQCRQHFVRPDLCSASWSLLESPVQSMSSLLAVILYKRNCTDSKLEWERMRVLLKCLISANAGFCEMQRQLTDDHLKCTQNSLSLANKDNVYNTVARSLNVPRFYVCRTINGFYKHFHFLNNLYPDDGLLVDDVWTKFMESIADSSDYNQYITLNEALTLQASPKTLQLIKNWNNLFEEVQQVNAHPQRPSLDPRGVYRTLETFQDINRDLVSIADQISHRPPPSLLNDLISSILRQPSEPSKVMLRTMISVEPRCVVEGRDVQVNLHLENPTDLDLRRLILKIRFLDSNLTRLPFKANNILHDSRFSSSSRWSLPAHRNISVQWIVSVVFSSKLRKPEFPKALVKVSFEVDRQWQSREVESEHFKVNPQGAVRVLVLMQPTLKRRDFNSPIHFSVMVVVINVGYAELPALEVVNIRPHVAGEAFVGLEPFNIDSMEIDGTARIPSLDIPLGRLGSGERRVITFNISTTKSDVAYLRNISLSCASENRLIDNLDLKKFYVKKQMNNDEYLLVDLSDMYPLYIYQTGDARLTPLDSMFLSQETREASAKPCLVSVVEAFSLAEESKQFDGPVIGHSPYVGSLNDSYSLFGIVQVFPNFDVLRRSIPMDRVWVQEFNGVRNVNFIDLSPFTNSHEIFYEFLFADSTCSNTTLFSRPEYHVPFNKDMYSKYGIVSQLQITGPHTGDVHYSLLSSDPEFPFAVLSDSGAIILMNNTETRHSLFCAYIEAKHTQGSANATVQFGGTSANCSNIPTTNLQDHSLSDVHNIPLDYNMARKEFLRKSQAFPTTPTTFLEESINVEVDDQEHLYELEPDSLLETTVIPTTVPSATKQALLQPTDTTTSATNQLNPLETLSETSKPSATTEKSVDTDSEVLSISPDHEPQQIMQVTPLATLATLATTTVEPLQTPHPTLTPSTMAVTPTWLENATRSSLVETAQVIPPHQSVAYTVVPATTPTNHTATIMPISAQPNKPTTQDDLLVNLITISTPPATSALPVATGVHLSTQMIGSFSSKDQITLGDAAAMVDMACKMRASKPTYRVMCDLAKTVYRTQ